MECFLNFCHLSEYLNCGSMDRQETKNEKMTYIQWSDIKKNYAKIMTIQFLLETFLG